jgi:hypothetical protein
VLHLLDKHCNTEAMIKVTFFGGSVIVNGAVFDQKISKFFVSHVVESMAEYVGVNGVH